MEPQEPDRDDATPQPAGTTEKETKGPEESPKKPAPEPLEAYLRVRNFLLGAAIVGLALPLVFALQAGSAVEKLSVAAVGIGIFGSAMTVGGLIGFVFGIPTSLQDTRTPGPPPAADGKALAPEATRALYAGNTSLEQISDWLTKILVGVGLTQLAALPNGLVELGDFLAGGLGNVPGANVFAPALVVFGVLVGFFLSYLWTRLNLPYLFAESDWLQRLRLERQEGRREGEKSGIGAAADASLRAGFEAGRVEGERRAIEAAAAATGAAAGAAAGAAEPTPSSDRKPPPSRRGAVPPAPAPAPVPTVLQALWVDDRPDNNVTERQALESLAGVRFDLARDTKEAIPKLTAAGARYAFVITDMGRPGDPRAGLDLIRQMRENRVYLPTIIYAGSATPDQVAEARDAGAHDMTNSPRRLIEIVSDVVGRLRRTSI